MSVYYRYLTPRMSVLGATSRGSGYLHGNGYVVTWALGHLAALAQPHEINPEWRHWRRDEADDPALNEHGWNAFVHVGCGYQDAGE